MRKTIGVTVLLSLTLLAACGTREPERAEGGRPPVPRPVPRSAWWAGRLASSPAVRSAALPAP